MKTQGAITITTVRNLELDDLIAWEFIGKVIGARVSAICYSAYDLTDTERNYMTEKGLKIPEKSYEPLGGETQTLVFLARPIPGESGYMLDHAFLDFDQTVAVFDNSAHRAEQFFTRDCESV